MHWGWYSNLQYITHGDLGIYLPETQGELIKNSFQIYNSSFNFGQINLNAGYKIIEFIQGVLAQLGIFCNISTRVLFLWPYVFLSPVAAYFLFSKFIKSKAGVFIAAIVYLFNTYVLLIQSGQFLILLGFTFLTFSLLFSYKFFIENNSLKNFMGLLFFLFLLSSYEFRIFYIGIFVIGFFVFYKSVFIKNHLKDWLFYIGAILITILLNFYWLLPLLSENKITNNEIFSRSLFGSQFFDIFSAFTLFHRFWTGGPLEIFTNQPIPFYFWLIPIFAILSLLPKNKNPFLLYFVILALLGIFLTKQSSHPFPEIYKWLYQKFPGFNAFREASKFYILTVLGYSILIGSAMDWIWQNFNKEKWKIYGKYCLIFIISFIFLWNTRPLITKEIKTTFVPRYIPRDYLVLNDFILKQPGYFRTMYTPRDSRWSVFTNQKTKISNVAVIGGDWKNFSEAYDKNEKIIQNRITNIFKLPFANNLLDISSARYVIVPLQDFANDDDFFIHYGGKEDPDIREWYISELDKVRFLKKIDIGTEELVVYENEGFRPHVYVTQEKETIYREVPYEAVEFEQKNPTEYKIKLKNLKGGAYLNFSESFHPDWKLRAGEFNWFSVLTNNAPAPDNTPTTDNQRSASIQPHKDSKGYFLPDNFHLKNNANLNSFKIDPNYIKRNHPESYTQNPDGSIDVELTLFFKPQSYFYLGLIISGLTLLGCLSYIAYDFSKRRKVKVKKESIES